MNDNTPNNLFLVCHDICFVHLVIRSNCVVLCRIVLYYVIVQFFILYLCLIVTYLSSFNINFLAHGKKDNYCLHETTVESIFKLLIYKICYNTFALMLKYIFIHSFICWSEEVCVVDGGVQPHFHVKTNSVKLSWDCVEV